MIKAVQSISGWRDAATSARALKRVADEMRACLEARGGEVSARSRAATLGDVYRALDDEGREQFFRLLGSFDVDPLVLQAATGALRDAPGEEERSDRARALREALKPPWIRLLTQFNSIPGGVKFLVDMRADLLQIADREPVFRRIDADLREILASWFDIGFLELRRITWSAPAAFLERLASYEAVHEIRSWLDLKNRLEGNRRCFAFMHPAMPDEPLIFVQVALTNKLSGDVTALLDRRAAPTIADPSVAIFYSISNCQKGLSGISFGNALIKRVVDLLSLEFRSVRTFATLSPIPGFRAWLQSRLAEEPEGIAAMLGRRGWPRDPEAAEALRIPLLRLCAHYLLKEKGRNGFVRDPVEHFHLSNGARLERINWLSDLSPKGLRESAGMMVNYIYSIDHIDDNHESYMAEGRIASSSSVRDLLRASR